MTPAEAAQRLRERAESYWRDSVSLGAHGDLQGFSAAYRAIADELRKVAQEISETA